MQALGVTVAAALIWYQSDWRIADPLTTFTFALLVVWTSRNIVVQCVGVLMEAAPPNVHFGAVHRALTAIEGVVSVHDLHIWQLSMGRPSLCVHVLAQRGCDSERILEAAQRTLAHLFRIHHTTIQIEATTSGGAMC